MKKNKNKKIKKAVNKESLGFNGIAHFGGYVSSEIKPLLRGSEGVKTYRAMADDNATIGSILFAITTLIQQAEASVEAHEDDVDERNAEFLKDNIDNLITPFKSVIANALSSIIYGWSISELLYEQRDGKVVVSDIAFRAQNTLFNWKIEDDVVLGFVQQHPSNYSMATIPLEKTIHFKIGDQTNPEGRSLLRNSYISSYHLKELQRMEAIQIERSAASTPILRVPGELMGAAAGTAEKAAYDAYVTLADNLRIHETSSIILPSDVDPDTKTPLYSVEPYKTVTAIDIDTAITRYETEILRTLLGDFIALGSGSTGSFALSSDKTRLFSMAISSILENIKETLNDQYVKRLFKLNGIETNLPKIKFGDIESEDLAALGTFVAAMTSVGHITPDEETEAHLRNIAGLPKGTDTL